MGFELTCFIFGYTVNTYPFGSCDTWKGTHCALCPPSYTETSTFWRHFLMHIINKPATKFTGQVGLHTQCCYFRLVFFYCARGAVFVTVICMTLIVAPQIRRCPILRAVGWWGRRHMHVRIMPYWLILQLYSVRRGPTRLTKSTSRVGVLLPLLQTLHA